MEALITRTDGLMFVILLMVAFSLWLQRYKVFNAGTCFNGCCIWYYSFQYTYRSNFARCIQHVVDLLRTAVDFDLYAEYEPYRIEKTDKRACFGTDFCNQLCLSGRNCSGYFLCSKNCGGLEMCRNVRRNLHWRYSKPDCYCNRSGLFERNTGSCKCSRLGCFHPIDGIPVCSSNADEGIQKMEQVLALPVQQRRAGGRR